MRLCVSVSDEVNVSDENATIVSKWAHTVCAKILRNVHRDSQIDQDIYHSHSPF